MEIGNLIFGHSRGEYHIDRSLQTLFILGLEALGFDNYGYMLDDPTSDYARFFPDMGTDESHTDSFEIRPYWWGDEDAREAALPNFIAKNVPVRGVLRDVEVSWYKYALRDAYSNIPLDEEDIYSIFDALVLRNRHAGFAPPTPSETDTHFRAWLDDMRRRGVTPNAR